MTTGMTPGWRFLCARTVPRCFTNINRWAPTAVRRGCAYPSLYSRRTEALTWLPCSVICSRKCPPDPSQEEVGARLQTRQSGSTPHASHDCICPTKKWRCWEANRPPPISAILTFGNHSMALASAAFPLSKFSLALFLNVGSGIVPLGSKLEQTPLCSRSCVQLPPRKHGPESYQLFSCGSACLLLY